MFHYFQPKVELVTASNVGSQFRVSTVAVCNRYQLIVEFLHPHTKQSFDEITLCASNHIVAAMSLHFSVCKQLATRQGDAWDVCKHRTVFGVDEEATLREVPFSAVEAAKPGRVTLFSGVMELGSIPGQGIDSSVDQIGRVGTIEVLQDDGTGHWQVDRRPIADSDVPNPGPVYSELARARAGRFTSLWPGEVSICASAGRYEVTIPDVAVIEFTGDHGPGIDPYEQDEEDMIDWHDLQQIVDIGRQVMREIPGEGE